MPENNTSNNDSKDSKSKNPCGICRANGSLVCKGHGGGSSGGGGSNEAEKNPHDSVHTSAPALTPNTLEARLALGLVMESPDETESAFILQNPDAIYTLKLDMWSGLMVFSGNKALTEEQQATLDKFFDTIQDELNSFKQELIKRGEKTESVDQIKIAREGSVLTLKFQNPKYYDEFLQRLIDKNILQIDATPQQTNSRMIEPPNLARPSSSEEPSSQPTTPTPFDIKRGPKPDGWN